MSRVEERHQELLAALQEIVVVALEIRNHLMGIDEDDGEHADWQHGSHIDSMPTQPPSEENKNAPAVPEKT